MKQPKPATDLVGRQQLREELGISHATAWRWIKTGILPKPVILGGKQYFRRSELPK